MNACASKTRDCGEERLPLVYVIIVNHNGLHWNEPCLDSLLAQEAVRVKVIFVDNASTDGSLAQVRNRYAGEGLDCLSISQNVLFAAGCNAGIAQALEQGAQWLFLLNNDTVVEPGCLAGLAAFLVEHPGAAGVQPLLTRLNDTGRVASAGCRVSRMGGAWDHASGAQAGSLGHAAFEMPGISAGASLWRGEALRRIGLFDTDFGMYFEDVDLSLRARKLGYTLYTLPSVRVRHKVSATTGEAAPGFCVRYCQTNALRLILKHWPRKWFADACFQWLLTSVLAFVANLVYYHNWRTAQAIGLGTLKGLGLMPRGLWRRRGSPENELLVSWIDRTTKYPPRPEA